MDRVRIAVAGAGTIGTRHIEEVDACVDTELSAIVDPFPAAAEVASKFAVPLYSSLAQLFRTGKPDGVVLATPNKLHVEGGLACVAAGVPVLVEKPVADSVDGARRLVEAGEAAGVPILTGHHRQHSPIMAKTREIIGSGRLGTIVAVSGTALFYKPDGYFDAGGGWRRQIGGGVLLINLSHEVNNLLSLIGDVDSVQAITSDAARGFPVEDTAAIIFRFANGALGTFLVSDTAASARSWEQTSQENEAYSWYGDEDCYHIAGTKGSLSVPTMRIKEFSGERSWSEPLDVSTETVERADPLARQISNFARVVRGVEEPIVTARSGLKTVQVLDAVMESARTGELVKVATG